jgi:hypothetical protein
MNRMPARVAARVEQRGECLVWTGGRNGKGYGSIRVSRTRTALVHRFVYEQMVGRIPTGLTIDHICENQLCQNVRHMEPVTRAENTIRAARARQRRRIAAAAERWRQMDHIAA